MRGLAIKVAALTGGCAVLALVFWVRLANRQKVASPNPVAPAIAVAVDATRASGHPKGRGVVTRIEAVWSQYALPGEHVEIWWTRDPRSTEPKHECIIDDTVVLTPEGFGTYDDEPSDIITVDLTPEQAKRLHLPKGGWLRALLKAAPAD